MIELLTQQILAVCPIDGVADLGAGQYRIDYRDDATEAQIAAAEAIALSWPLTAARSAKMAELDAGCQAAITGGFSSMALGAVHGYSSQLEDQLNIMGAAMSGIDLPYVCTDQAGVKLGRLHTAAQISQVYMDGVARKLLLVNHFHSLRQQVEAAGTVEAVEAIAWSEPEN